MIELISFNGVEELLKAVSPSIDIASGKHVFEIMPQRHVWEAIHQEISVHGRGDVLPKVKLTRPNEPASSSSARMRMYEPITTPYWQRALGRVRAVILSTPVDIAAAEKTVKYIEENHFDGLKLFDFFATKYSQQVIENPNGMTVTYPPKWAEGKGVNPVQFVKHDEILFISDEAVVFVSSLESEYSLTYFSGADGNKDCDTRKEPLRSYHKVVYHLFTKEEFASATRAEEGGESGWQYEKQRHGLGFIPAMQNGGVEHSDRVFLSHFHRAIPFGNESLNRHSDNLAVNMNFSYPHASVLAEECPNTECVNGKVSKYDGDTGEYAPAPCERCKGTGSVVILSPNKIMQRKRMESNVDTPPDNRPMMEFYHPDIGILDYSTRTWKDYLELYKKALCIYDRRESGGAESAQSIELQLNPMLAFMTDIGLTLYNGLESIIKAIQLYLNPNAANPIVTRPVSYQLQTEGEALNVISSLLNSDASPIMRQQKIVSYIKRYVGKSSVLLKYIKALELADPYFYYPTEQKAKILAAGGMDGKEYRASVLAFGVLLKLAADDGNRELTERELADKLTEELVKMEKPEPQSEGNGGE